MSGVTHETERKRLLKLPPGTGSLVGVDSNAYALVGYTKKRLRRAGWDRKDLAIFSEIAFSGNYDQLVSWCASFLEDDG